MVNFLYRSQPTFLKTHLTEWMLCRIAVTNAFPRSAVLAVDIGAALVFVVLAAFLRTVLFTKLCFTEVGAAGMRTRVQWFYPPTRFGSERRRKYPPLSVDAHLAIML